MGLSERYSVYFRLVSQWINHRLHKKMSYSKCFANLFAMDNNNVAKRAVDSRHFVNRFLPLVFFSPLSVWNSHFWRNIFISEWANCLAWDSSLGKAVYYGMCLFKNQLQILIFLLDYFRLLMVFKAGWCKSDIFL